MSLFRKKSPVQRVVVSTADCTLEQEKESQLEDLERVRRRDSLLTAEELPQGFLYPRGLLRLVELDLLELEPWQIVTGEYLRSTNLGLAGRYPTRHLLLFARRQDNDDCVCFDLDTGRVSLVHDWALPGWEAQGEFADFDAWLHSAIDDLIEF